MDCWRLRMWGGRFSGWICRRLLRYDIPVWLSERRQGDRVEMLTVWGIGRISHQDLIDKGALPVS